MLTEIYIEALLVDEEVADQVWELWNIGMIPDDLAAWASCILAFGRLSTETPNQTNLGARLDED